MFEEGENTGVEFRTVTIIRSAPSNPSHKIIELGKVLGHENAQVNKRDFAQGVGRFENDTERGKRKDCHHIQPVFELNASKMFHRFAGTQARKKGENKERTT